MQEHDGTTRRYATGASPNPSTRTLTRQVAAWAGYQGRGATQLAPWDPTTAGPQKTRPARPLQPRFRKKVRPASVKTPILGCFERAGRTFSRSRPPSGHAGRTFSRTRRDNKATLKPASPLLSPNKGPLKPASPLRPKTAPKTPISHPQRRWRFQSHTGTSKQRRRWFQTTGPPGRQGQAAAPAGPFARTLTR